MNSPVAPDTIVRSAIRDEQGATEKGRVMLSKKMVGKLNDQINLEFYSSNLYLQMSSWCEHAGLEGCSGFLRRHADTIVLADEAAAARV